MSSFIMESNKHFFVDKAKLRQLMDEIDKITGFVPDPDATPESSRQYMEDLGIRAEDNIFSCGIIAARDEE